MKNKNETELQKSFEWNLNYAKRKSKNFVVLQQYKNGKLEWQLIDHRRTFSRKDFNKVAKYFCMINSPCRSRGLEAKSSLVGGPEIICSELR